MTFEEEVAAALRHIGLDGINNPSGEEIAPHVAAAIEAAIDRALSLEGLHWSPDKALDYANIGALAALRGSDD